MSVARLSRSLIGTAVIGALAAPALIAMNAGGISLASSSTVPVEQRVSRPPNVMFPVVSSRARDLRTYGTRPGTVIKAPCGSTVRSSFAGVAKVTRSAASGRHLVLVTNSKGKVVGYYGFMRSHVVRTGQTVRSGQKLGTVGRQGIAQFCSLYFAITSNGAKTNASVWLNTYVGKPLPVVRTVPPVVDPGLTVATFNTLGASHSQPGGSASTYPSYSVRTPKQVTLLNGYHVDVVGLQEFQKPQRTSFLAAAGSTFGIYPPATDTTADTDNSIIWRSSTMQLIDATLIDIPYFNGRTRKMPLVELQQIATGRTAWFLNVHNPASVSPYGDQSKWRAQAIAIERAKIIALRQTGSPVIMTGDLNDRDKAYCPLSAGMLLYAANAVPSSTCAMPPKPWFIDWVLGSGATLSQYRLDWAPKDQRLTDHPIVLSKVELKQSSPPTGVTPASPSS